MLSEQRDEREGERGRNRSGVMDKEQEGRKINSIDMKQALAAR